MDGLEISELTLGTVRDNTYDFRIESEFHKKCYVDLNRRLYNCHAKMLMNGMADMVTDGTHFTPEYFDVGVPFLSALNVKENDLDLDAGYKFISEKHHKILCKRVHPKSGDILLRKVGVGARYACVVPDGAFDFSIFVSLACIRANINPYYLSTFINSKYGQMQLLRFNKGISQPDLHLEDIKRLLVPEFSEKFYTTIEDAVRVGNTALDKSRMIYKEAAKELEDYFSFDLCDRQSIGTVKSMSESFGVSKRLDAEYYEPKYDRLFARLNEFPTKRLGGKRGIVTTFKSLEPGSDMYCEKGIPFVRVSDVTKYGICEPAIKLPVDLVEDAQNFFPKKDTILFSKDGSVGIAYQLEEDAHFFTSSALLHLTVRDPYEILPEYLTLVLNSSAVQLQAQRDSNGAVIQHWKPSEIENVIVPILDMETQNHLKRKVQESFMLRRQAMKWIKAAKDTVEAAVEQGEEKAVRLLEQSL